LQQSIVFENLSTHDVHAITVYDMTGKMIIIKKTENEDEQIDMSFYNDGMYIVDLSGMNIKRQLFIGN